MKKYDAELVVMGCLPKINKDRLDKVFDGVSYGPKERNKIKDLIGSDKDIPWKEQNTIDDADIAELPHRQVVHKVAKMKKMVGRIGEYILP